jgi:hypothetical protein
MIVNACDQLKPESKPFSPVAIFISDNLKTLEHADGIFI